MKAIAETLRVSQSNVIRRVNGEGQARRASRKPGDQDLLAQRALVNQRPSYGYRRIGALLNRVRERLGQPAVNHKRVNRLMKQNNLLLSRHTGKQPIEQAREGEVYAEVRSALVIGWIRDLVLERRGRQGDLHYRHL